MKTLVVNLLAIAVIIAGGVMLSSSTPAHSTNEWEACCWSGDSVCCGDRCEASDGDCCANTQCDTPKWNDELD